MGTVDLERWREMPLTEQMANIGSEVGRTRKWTEKGNPSMAESAFLRALALSMQQSVPADMVRIREVPS